MTQIRASGRSLAQWPKPRRPGSIPAPARLRTPAANQSRRSSLKSSALQGSSGAPSCNHSSHMWCTPAQHPFTCSTSSASDVYRARALTAAACQSLRANSGSPLGHLSAVVVGSMCGAASEDLDKGRGELSVDPGEFG